MKPYHLTRGASQNNAFTAHLYGRTEIDWAPESRAAVTSKVATAIVAKKRAQGQDLIHIANLSKEGNARKAMFDATRKLNSISIDPRPQDSASKTQRIKKGGL